MSSGSVAIAIVLILLVAAVCGIAIYGYLLMQKVNVLSQQVQGINILSQQVQKLQQNQSKIINAGTTKNPLTWTLSSDKTTHVCQIQILGNNQFNQDLNATITQALPAGMKIVKTSGTVDKSLITWKGLVKQNSSIKEFFSFTLSKTSGGLTNMLSPTMLLTYGSNNQKKGLFYSSAGYIKQSLCPTLP